MVCFIFRKPGPKTSACDVFHIRRVLRFFVRERGGVHYFLQNINALNFHANLVPYLNISGAIIWQAKGMIVITPYSNYSIHVYVDMGGRHNFQSIFFFKYHTGKQKSHAVFTSRNRRVIHCAQNLDKQMRQY